MEYDPVDPAVTRNPYPHYAWLRREAPVYRTPQGLVAVSRYADVRGVLNRPGIFSSSAMGDVINGLKAMAQAAEGGETLLGTDPPAHTQLRRIANRAFRPRRIAALEPRIRAHAIALVDALASDSECDLMAALAVPLPVMVIAEILGFDSARRGDLKRWTEEQIAATAGPPGPELRAALARSASERLAYLDELVAERRRHPRDDVISELLRAESTEELMSEAEVGNFIVLLLVAGNETTTNLIGNAMLALLAEGDLLAPVASEPSLIPAVVEETLRYDSPVQLTLRRVREDVELAGEKLHRGELLALLLGSANRDERHFGDPDRFDLLRPRRDHLAFGFGTHFCLGAHLARLETRVVLETLLARFRRFEPLAEAERAPSLLTRGPRSLRLGLG